MGSSMNRVFHSPKMNLHQLHSTELRVSLSSEMIESLWREFFREPSLFIDVRHKKKNYKSPDFRHKYNGKALWIDRFSNPPWVRPKLERMEFAGVDVEANDDRDAIVQLIKSFGNKKDISMLRRIWADKRWITQDIVIATTLIRSYAKCGALREAKEVFEQLKEPNVVSWTALISGYADQGFGEEALRSFREMQRNKVIPNSVTYICTLKACATIGALEIVKEIYAQVRELGLLNKGISLGSALVNAFAKCGGVNEAREVFEQLVEPNVVSWNALIVGYADQGLAEEALACFRNMQRYRMTPDSVTYISALKACAIARAVEVVGEIHNQVRDIGLLNRNIALGNTIIDAYAKCGAVKEARKVFEQLEQPSVASWNALIAGYAQHGFGEEALAYFREMQRKRVTPDSVTYVCAFKACASLASVHIVDEIHAQVREQALVSNDIVLGSALVNAYAKCGAVKEAREVFKQLKDPNVVSWNALIAGYSDQGFAEEALICFRQMQNNRVTPNTMTYICVLKACAILGVVEVVEEIHVCVRNQGFLREDINLQNTLVDAYAKCGAMKEAREVFEQLTEPNVVSWTALIAGYTKVGCMDEMLELLNRMMMSGIFPDFITYTVLLNGCSHGALLEEGQILFGIIGAHGIGWTTEQYTCIVDLFGRAGLLDNAKHFVLDHTLTLLAFLGACRNWVKVDHARWAFEKLIQLSPKCDSAYLCMSNIYAAAGMMKEAEEVEFLRARLITSKQTSLFVANAILCQRTHENLTLQQLCDKLLNKRHFPDFRLLPRPVLDHENENIFCCHIEKLAIACALVNKTEGEQIPLTTTVTLCAY